MRGTIRSIFENRWLQESIILIFSFVLFTMNDWVLVSSWANLWKGCCFFLILYTHAQINRFFLLPYLLEKHKPVLYTFLSIVLALIFSLILYSVATSWLYKNCYLYKSTKQQGLLFHIATVVATFICIMGPVLLLRFYREQKKQASETILFNQLQLNALRNQLNPHFLFNTFNTLYGISIQYPSRMPNLIMQVSQLMRYQLESDSQQWVGLADELAFIESYIALEKERVGHRCTIGYQCDFDLENNKIPPMLLVVFIENAFKHGCDTIDTCFVKINIEVKHGQLTLNVSNSIPKHKTEVVSNHIGLNNTIKRLDILYKSRYALDIHQTENEHFVTLQLELKAS